MEESIDMNKVPGKEVIMDQVQTEKQHKKKESVFAIDLEMSKVSAELADGVEAMIHVQSIFSENARIRVLLEGIMLSCSKLVGLSFVLTLSFATYRGYIMLYVSI